MKDIIGYEGLYAITSCGKVWSYRSQKFMKPRKDKDGYLLVNLHKEGKQITFRVHRLVAKAYIPNPEGKETVNHKDENKQNNNVNNLEWLTRAENNNYGTHNKRSAIKRRKPVYCVELDRVFDSITEAAKETNTRADGISACCIGRNKTCFGYHWRYVDE